MIGRAKEFFNIFKSGTVPLLKQLCIKFGLTKTTLSKSWMRGVVPFDSLVQMMNMN